MRKSNQEQQSAVGVSPPGSRRFLMALKLTPPLLPMEAQSVERMPRGDAWQYEPKWDGFRSIVFRDESGIELQSKSGQPLTRYFPELVEIFARLPGPSFVLDGEIVVPAGESYDFDALLQRIHPAASRVTKLAAETPARFIVFDLLVDAGGARLAGETLDRRRPALETFVSRCVRGTPAAGTIRLSPTTADVRVAKRW